MKALLGLNCRVHHPSPVEEIKLTGDKDAADVKEISGSITPVSQAAVASFFTGACLACGQGSGDATYMQT
jgi:hypothetical protein